MLLQEASKHPGDYFEILLALFAELRGGEVRGYGMRTLIQKNIQSAWLASIRQIILWRIAMDNFLVSTIWKKKIQRVQVPVFCEWLIFYSREQRAKRTCLHVHLATAARVKYPAALLRCKFDAP